MQKPFDSQPHLFITPKDLEHKAMHKLDEAESLFDWDRIEGILKPIYGSDTGRPSYPLVTLFRALLLGVWYKSSDVQLSEMLFCYLPFRKFCHLELGDAVPDASTLGRFRNQLVKHDLWEHLLSEINAQLESKNIIMTEGRINIVDATPVEAHQWRSGKKKDGTAKRDPEAGWHVKQDSRGNIKSTYGYSVHTGVDEDGFIHRQTVSSGNVHDSMEIETLILGDEEALYADKGYCYKRVADTLERFNIENRVQRKGVRNHPLSEADKIYNTEIGVIRSGVERTFAVYKTHYGLSKTRFLGLAKNRTFYGIAAIAHNIRKGAKFLTRYGLPEPV